MLTVKCLTWTRVTLVMTAGSHHTVPGHTVIHTVPGHTVIHTVPGHTVIHTVLGHTRAVIHTDPQTLLGEEVVVVMVMMMVEYTLFLAVTAK
jgi:hypothetical protein